MSTNSQQPIPHIANKAAPGISYYTPLQSPPAGTASTPQSDHASLPRLFQPLTIRGLTLQNRIFVSPLCQYSSEDGHVSHWQLTHLGGLIQRGPGLTFTEATAVQPEGRITPQDAGLWQDSQIEPFRQIVEFAHGQGQRIGIQLAHAGRKASTVAPWLSMGATATREVGGWPEGVVAPSAVPFNDAFPKPREMTLEEIMEFKTAYVAAVRRAVKAGFDVIEIHGAHGYLLHEFVSPHSNKRTDQYGGSFENRVRLPLELVELVRAEIPDSMPLFYRVSATDWLEETEYKDESWKVEDTARFAALLAEKGVDLLDVSSGGNSQYQRIKAKGAYQAPFAKKVKESVKDKILVTSVGGIKTGKVANELLEEEPQLDAVFAGKGFLKDPFLVWSWAEELGVQIQLPNQIRWAFGGRGVKAPDKSDKSKI